MTPRTSSAVPVELMRADAASSTKGSCTCSAVRLKLEGVDAKGGTKGEVDKGSGRSRR